MNKNKEILNTISDLVANFCYYDRKEDEDLSVEDLENSIKNGEISIDEMADHFKNELKKAFFI